MVDQLDAGFGVSSREEGRGFRRNANYYTVEEDALIVRYIVEGYGNVGGNANSYTVEEDALKTIPNTRGLGRASLIALRIFG